VCPSVSLDDLEKMNVPCRYRDLNSASLNRDSAVTVITTLIVTATLTVITTPSRIVFFVVRNSMCETVPTVETFIMISYK
jgi:hypothetical protein